MYALCMITGCILCWITIYDNFSAMLSLTSSLLYYIARYIMLLIFIARLYVVFQETKFRAKPRYFIILIVISSFGIIVSIFGVIIYFYCEFGRQKCEFNSTSITAACFGIYFVIDLIVTVFTIFKFRHNLLVLFKERKSDKIINLTIKYTNLFFWCFISTFLFILIGVSLVGALNGSQSFKVLTRNSLIQIDILFNSFCLYMSIPYFGKNTYNKCCNKIHLYYYQKYTLTHNIQSNSDMK